MYFSRACNVYQIVPERVHFKHLFCALFIFYFLIPDTTNVRCDEDTQGSRYTRVPKKRGNQKEGSKDRINKVSHIKFLWRRDRSSFVTCKLQHGSFMRRTHFGRMPGHRGTGVYPQRVERRLRPALSKCQRLARKSHWRIPGSNPVRIQRRCFCSFVDDNSTTIREKSKQVGKSLHLFRKYWNASSPNRSYALKIHLLEGGLYLYLSMKWINDDDETDISVNVTQKCIIHDKNFHSKIKLTIKFSRTLIVNPYIYIYSRC